jgi:CRISPR-associated endonuclease Csn1
MSKKILGLDLGTNSIGWALIEQNFENKTGNILGMGSRIIPMSQDILGEFGKGNSVSQTAERTNFRSARRLRERHLLRRERLHRVLNILGFLPKHYANQIDFEKKPGKFFDEKEAKIAWKEITDNKFEFVFQKSFKEMLEDFRNDLPELLNRKNKKDEDAKVPYDWTIYYLRKKALSQKIEKEELAWLLLNFNQKRGYYQLRGEEDEVPSNIKEYVEVLKVVAVVKGEHDKKNDKKYWYNITLENGWNYSATFSTEPQWLDTEKEFLVIEELDENGNIKIVKERKQDKNGKEKRKITPLPSFEEIDLMSKQEQDKIHKKIKAKTEITISNSGQTVGTYIYNNLLQKPNQKIRGKLVRTIERKFYKEELKQILRKQIELQPELFSSDLYNDCLRELYRNNEAHQLTLSKRDFVHLFLNDIIFYQRPLKSQKSSIGNCLLESRKYKDEKGNEKIQYLKAVPKSNPYYQEFRIWQWLYNLKIYKKENDVDVTLDFIDSIEAFENLFTFLKTKKEVDHEDILKHFFESKKLTTKEIKAEIAKYRWNYVYDSLKNESKKYPCNETGYEIRRRLEKVVNISDNFLTSEIEQHLWHIIYSVTDKNEFEKALKSFAKKYELDENSFLENFRKFPPFKSEYGSYSEKALKKLLPLLRIGKYWNWNLIDTRTKDRISKIITGEYDEEIKKRVREKAIHFTEQNNFQGLQLWLAQYIIYDRHTEAALVDKWKSVIDLEKYLEEFKQHSLRNPIVEQVVTETLRVVKDIWVKYGNGAENYFNEIHIELGREMKNTAEDRKQITNQILENENTNIRIKALIMELKENSDDKLPVENVRPYSPMQQEALKIYEDGILNSSIEIPDDIIKISKTAQPSKSELQRYKLWLEQRYRSPYTGKMIPLNRLFTDDYQIEHIIPQSRYFDDSFSNKVICEAAVNQLKDNQLGLEFIKNHYEQIIETGKGYEVKIFNEDEYKNFVKQHYDRNRSKRSKLLLEEIPDKMIERQLNDTRYISKFISNVLSNIVRADKNDDGINSKNIIPSNGKITSTLKQDWGFNDVWNELIIPRFERMNQLTNSKNYTTWNETHQKFLPTVPLNISKGFQKKRIDHRHHALDALVIACASKDHMNYLNNESANKKGTNDKGGLRYDLKHKLCFKTKPDDKGNYKWIFKKPWDTITQDTREVLEKIVVSFKQNLRVINKTSNQYEKFVEKNGKKVKELVTQIKGDSWAIRKSMHKDTVSGEVKLDRIKVPKGKLLTATRKSINTSFDLNMIKSITDTGIQKILINYLASKNDNPELAFSPEGIEEMNKNIYIYNDNKPHQPIYKVRIFELGSKFRLGQTGNKKTKFVEAAKGTNLFFAIYQDENGKRNYDTIPLNEVIEHQKQVAHLSQKERMPIQSNSQKGKFLFELSPNDLIYVPTTEEKNRINKIDFKNLDKEQMRRVYKMVSSTGSECHFIQANIASLIKTYDAKSRVGELGSLNKLETTMDNSIRIKESCIKLKVDRLGNVKLAN